MKISLEELIVILFTFILGLVIGGLFGYCSSSKNNTNSSPVEECRIDSLKVERDSIKIVVERLDSIKNAEIIEVSHLDNDSTVKLFYKLVKE